MWIFLVFFNVFPKLTVRTKRKTYVFCLPFSPCWLRTLEGSEQSWKGEEISIISDTILSKAQIIDMHAMMSKSSPTDDSQTAFGPWNVQGPFSDGLTSNGARFTQSNSSRCGIYWLTQASGETRGESKNRFPPPDQFLFCQSCPHQWALEKGGTS